MDAAQHTVMMTTVGKGAALGTTLWMAPEVLLGKAYNEKIDVCECLSAPPPPPLSTRVSRACSHLGWPPCPPPPAAQTPSRCV